MQLERLNTLLLGFVGPKVETGNNIVTAFVFIGINDLEGSVAWVQDEFKTVTYLSSGRVKHADVFPGHQMRKFTCLHVSDLDEVRLEC